MNAVRKNLSKRVALAVDDSSTNVDARPEQVAVLLMLPNVASFRRRSPVSSGGNDDGPFDSRLPWKDVLALLHPFGETSSPQVVTDGSGRAIVAWLE